MPCFWQYSIRCSASHKEKKMKVTERRLVRQQWYETDTTKTGWDSHGWTFDNGEQMDDSWTIVSHLTLDKH